MTDTNDLLYTLAWSLLHFLWQGAAIAALAAACMFVFRRPATRYLVGIGALALMLASFAITFALVGGSSGSDAHQSVSTASVAAPLQSSAEFARQFMAPQDTTAPAADFLWIARGWLVGVCGFALRIAFGLLLIEHLRRRNLVALPDALVDKFRALQQRLGIRRVIRYCECRMLRVPAVIGIFRPIVLLPMRALTGLSEEQLEAVIAHELGHIKRLDVAVNFFQVITETLFFFHPAVWWLNRRIRADREDCCDDVAMSVGGGLGYARALATMESWRSVPSFAMAATGSPVAARVARLLGVTRRDSGGRAAGVVTASLVLATALVAGAFSVGVANPARAQSTEVSLEDLVAQADAAAQVVSVDPDVDIEPKVEAEVAVEIEHVEEVQQVEAVQRVEEVEQVQRAEASQRAEKAVREPPPPRAPKPAVAPTPAVAPKPAAAPTPPRGMKPARELTARSARGTSYIEEMRSVGLDNLDVDQLIALKTHGVTVEFIGEVRGTGLNPSIDALIAMKNQDISAAYVKEIRAVGFDPDADQLIAMKIHGLTPEYVRTMRDLGISPRTSEFINLKIHDVTPEFVRQIRAAGFNPKADEFIAMKIHDVTPEYHRTLEKAGYKLSIAQTIAAKVMDITPEFIEKARASGFKDMTVDKLIHLKNADIL